MQFIYYSLWIIKIDRVNYTIKIFDVEKTF